MSGLNIAEASSLLFISALKKSVSEILNIDESNVKNITNKAIENRRVLLSGVKISYMIEINDDNNNNTDNNMDNNGIDIGNNKKFELYKKQLFQCISNDSFKNKLISYSGISIDSIYDFHLAAVSTTFSPSMTPSEIITKAGKNLT